MEQYFISGIWTSRVNGEAVITHVMLHESDKDKKFKAGKRVHQDSVIKLLKKENVVIYTIEWSYKFKEWQKGTVVSFEKQNETEYLVTKRDDAPVNSLSTLLPMKVLTAKSKAPEVVAL
jgi:hypothetical protein